MHAPLSVQDVKSKFTLGVRGELSLAVDVCMCTRCDSTTQEADLAKHILVDGETFSCVRILCYLGDTLDGDGGADLATTA